MSVSCTHENNRGKNTLCELYSFAKNTICYEQKCITVITITVRNQYQWKIIEWAALNSGGAAFRERIYWYKETQGWDCIRDEGLINWTVSLLGQNHHLENCRSLSLCVRGEVGGSGEGQRQKICRSPQNEMASYVLTIVQENLKPSQKDWAHQREWLMDLSIETVQRLHLQYFK